MTTTTPIDLDELRSEVMEIRERDGGNPRVHPNGFIQLDLDEQEGSCPDCFGTGWETMGSVGGDSPNKCPRCNGTKRAALTWAESHKAGHSGGVRRLHIWNPPMIALPHQGTVNEIHDHAFDMRSTIVKGQLWQRMYAFIVGVEEPSTHQLYRAVYGRKSDSRLEATGVNGVVNVIDRYPVAAGNSYTQPASTFHDTETPMGLVVTVMEKVAIRTEIAHVLVPIGVEPDNSYDRAGAMSRNQLWKAIERSLA